MDTIILFSTTLISIFLILVLNSRSKKINQKKERIRDAAERAKKISDERTAQREKFSKRIDTAPAALSKREVSDSQKVVINKLIDDPFLSQVHEHIDIWANSDHGILTEKKDKNARKNRR